MALVAESSTFFAEYNRASSSAPPVAGIVTCCEASGAELRMIHRNGSAVCQGNNWGMTTGCRHLPEMCLWLAARVSGSGEQGHVTRKACRHSCDIHRSSFYRRQQLMIYPTLILDIGLDSYSTLPY